MTLFLNRTNYCTNPSAELDDAGLTNGFSGTTMTRDNTHVPAGFGSWAFKAAWPTASVAAMYQTVPGLIVGMTYAYALRAYVPTGSPAVHADVFFVGSGSDIGATKDAYVVLTGTFTATNDTHYVGIVTSAASTVGQAAWMDAVIVVMGASQSTAYFSGATADDADHDYRWLGTPNASASEEWVTATQTPAWPGEAYPGRTYPGDDLTMAVMTTLAARAAGVPLMVRLAGPRGVGSYYAAGPRGPERRLTRQIHDLSFSTTAPGGFGTCTVDLNEPLDIEPRDFAQFGRLYIYDGRNGETVYEGRLDDPSRSVGADGQVWSLTAVGGSAHTTDTNLALTYLDRSLDGWEHSISASYDLKAGNAETRTGEATDTGNTLYVQIPASSPVATGDRVAFNYLRFQESGQNAALLNYQWDAGGTTTNYHARSISSTSVCADQDITTAGGDPTVRLIGVHFNTYDKVFALMIYRAGAPETPGVDSNWVTYTDIRVGATRYNLNGTEKLSGYSSADETISAGEVVADLIGRCLPQVDGPSALIASTTFEFEHLSYPDAITPQQVLNDLATFEPGYYWAIWESNPDNDKWLMEYRAWPTSVQYEASTADGFDAPSSGAELFNKVNVRWKLPNGRTRITTRTSTIRELDAAVGGPLVRTALIDAADNTVATVTAANRLGDQFLAEHQFRGNAGRLRIAHPIWDYERCRMVRPWEIRAGALIRVRGTLPSPDLLNRDDRDATTVFRIASTNFSQSEASVELELDAYAPDIARALARLEQQVTWRRRR